MWYIITDEFCGTASAGSASSWGVYDMSVYLFICTAICVACAAFTVYNNRTK